MPENNMGSSFHKSIVEFFPISTFIHYLAFKLTLFSFSLTFLLSLCLQMLLSFMIFHILLTLLADFMHSSPSFWYTVIVFNDIKFM